MKLKAEHKERANEIFKTNPKVDKLFVNHKGAFFTNKNYALNSVKGDKDKIAEIKKVAVPENTEEKSGEEYKVSITDNKGVVIAFPELSEEDEIDTGVKGVEIPADKRKKEQPANGQYDVSGNGYVFEEGLLTDIVDLSN